MIQTKGPKVIALVVSGLILAGTVHGRCPSQWTKKGDLCYGFSHGVLPWADALIVCHSLGGTLVESRDSTVNIWLTEEIRRRFKRNVWIGANDQFREGEFEWPSDNPRLGYRAFSPGNPSNSNGHCVHFRGWGRYSWNDAVCTNKYHYVCQMK